jgi:hypothetical protein
VGEEKLGLQAGGGDTVLGEVGGGGLQDGEKLHACHWQKRLKTAARPTLIRLGDVCVGGV